ncbi:MAG TPA: hypothetical protein VFK81_18495 [Terriglobales bacterium]|jgi:hypothetical protein|nr:hypothetical protein [Terriglobales bacterium]
MTQDLTSLIHSHSADELKRAASHEALSEELALALLERRDLPADALEALSKNAPALKSRRVLVGMIGHPKTPRHVSLPVIRHLYTFELMQLALSPAVLADIKKAAEETLVSRLEKITLGERITLARRASGRVAAALLLDSEPRVVEAAVTNPFLTEVLIVKALMSEKAPATLVELVCRDGRWSLRREVRIALLRHPLTPANEAAQLARSLPTGVLHELMQDARLPEAARECLQRELQVREQEEGKSAPL